MTVIQSHNQEEQKKELFLRQKQLLDTFLEHGAISREQYDKSLGDLIVKMGSGRMMGKSSNKSSNMRFFDQVISRLSEYASEMCEMTKSRKFKAFRLYRYD